MTFEVFPEKNIIAQIGPLTLYFYGAMYSLGAIGGIFITNFFAQKKQLNLSLEHITDSVFFLMLGGVIGGRIFEILVYNLEFYLSNPLQCFAVWNGGMSIHGGLIGGAIGFIWYWKRYNKTHSDQKIRLGEISGVIMPALAIGLMLGRFGNFMNDELYGRITESSIGMDFGTIDENGNPENRHPSQLYAMGKDFSLFLIASFFLLHKNFSHWKHGEIFCIFLASYGVLRFFVEFFREVDPVTGLFFGWITIGQILSLLMICISAVLWRMRKKLFS